MCLDTTETAGIPEPCSSPAGGQKYMSVLRCARVCFGVGMCVCVCVFTCDCVQGFNKLPGSWSTICQHSV